MVMRGPVGRVHQDWLEEVKVEHNIRSRRPHQQAVQPGYVASFPLITVHNFMNSRG